mmetsp:Transcript_13162/g.35839  ORF Transcript_13162/g.35839 Transcript_13162/m.35839 type:complete len:134 (+) Transcript_13162:1590-1991(+)|eukprot:CAMPEP_0202409698 /NCGR_PEP_ID=MMETSP1128-20130828/17448_1 /ASSEMBLY_ACC=CAM_ASM_000463 /TAXON_ID=3047 /ORGANISM="Dunaliella tertiolecta, Strain CCMP1320" /LENGTH=133 /DNA_ID=CAMNT_0049015077 /DNA_START=117 /DNA_END=518 /DNA_ORIENTATION=-
MGAAPSANKEGDDYYTQLENEAIRNTFPRGLEDEHARELKHKLQMCLMKNDWYFTAGGLAVGGFLTYFLRSIKPIGVAAVLAPAADWAYGRHVCKDCGDEYNEYRRQLTEHYREQADALRRQIRGEQETGTGD